MNQTIYVALLDEGTNVWRPVEAEHQRDDVYRITGRNLDPDDEEWEFQTGEDVRCQMHILAEVGAKLRATEKVARSRDALNTQHKIMAANPISIERREWTFEDLASFADDVRRELNDNTFFEMPSPTIKHQDIVLRLALFLMQWAIQNGGKAFLSPVDLVLSPTRVFIPDLCFYGREKMATGQVERDPKRLRVAPDLVVEILSPSTASRDRVLKLRRYAEFGVAHYWIIDPRERTLQAFGLENGRYAVEAVAGDTDSFSPALFRGLTLQMEELLGPDQPDFPETDA